MTNNNHLVIIITVKIYFASSSSGRNYCAKFLGKLSQIDKAAILAVLQDIQDHGFEL